MRIGRIPFLCRLIDAAWPDSGVEDGVCGVCAGEFVAGVFAEV